MMYIHVFNYNDTQTYINGILVLPQETVVLAVNPDFDNIRIRKRPDRKRKK